MNAIFADTFFFIALLNPRDDHHFEQAGFVALLKD
jgi:hypothetical protein